MPRKPPSHYFPDVVGKSLDGTTYTLPADFSAPLNLLILTFRDDLDRLADQWVLLAGRLSEGSDGQVAAYELPVIGKRFRLFKGIVNASIEASAQADAPEKARTIPLYVDRDDFADGLGLKNRKTVHVLLVQKSGRILWRGEGLLTPDQIAEAEKAVGRARKSTASPQ
jgi:hypothetical protein